MKMQTPILPIQAAGAQSAPQRANAGQSSDGAQFSQALSREMAQRQHSPAPAAAAAKQPAPPPPPHEGTPAPTPAKADQGKPAGASAPDGDEKDAAADAAADSPVADMLALVASFNQPAADPAAAAAQAAAAALKEGATVGAASRSLEGVDGAGLAAGGKGKSSREVAQGAAGGLAMKALDAGAASADPALARVKPDAGSVTARTGDAGERDGAGLAALKTDAAPLRAREAAADIAALREPAAPAPVSAPLQQASLAMAQAVTGAPTDRIAARVGTPGWDNQVGQKIVWMVAGKEQTATLTLNPPDMGPMQVVLSVTNDQATVTFSAAQPEVRQALEDAMPKLREMMGENGIALGNASVDAGSPGQRQAQQGEQPRDPGGRASFGRGGDGGATGIVEAPRVSRLGGGIGVVDTFA